MSPKEIRIEDFNYDLPNERIAFFPKDVRDSSKLLVYKKSTDTITDSTFDRLPEFLDSDMMLVFNDSRVIHARLLVQNPTGASIEIFCLEPVLPTSELTQALAETGAVTWKCFIGNAKRFKHPITFSVPVGETEVTVTAEKGEPVENAFLVHFSWNESVTFAEWVEAYGKMPLPPYIKRTAEKADEVRYQTVYAHYDGSVAAPTAGLHFSKPLMQRIKEQGIACEYVTLHVGAGTFKPVTADSIGEHFMHDEQIVIHKELIYHLLQNIDKKVICVGTTVTRSLESIFIIGAKLKLGLPEPFHVQQWEYYEDARIAGMAAEESLQSIYNYLDSNDLEYITASKQLMIAPSYRFKMMKGIITNFHQPKSTLLLLVSAYLGDEWHKLYRHALDENYRFLSYGDANLYLP